MAHSRPTIERRQLGAELRRLRVAAGKSQKEAAAVIECDASLLSRTERGERSLKAMELNALLDFYAAPEEKRQEVVELGKVARQRQPRRMYSDAFPGAFRRVSEHERQANEIYYSDGELIPGLLQTEDYVRELIAAGRSAVRTDSHDDVATRVQFRIERQQTLFTDKAPMAWFVIGEAALHRPVGSYQILRDQLEHLLDLIETQQRIVIQVAPLAIADHPLLGGSLGVFRFDGTVPDVAHQATLLGGGVYLDDEEDVAECMYAFDRLRAVALGPKESANFIGERIKELDDAPERQA